MTLAGSVTSIGSMTLARSLPLCRWSSSLHCFNSSFSLEISWLCSFPSSNLPSRVCYLHLYIYIKPIRPVLDVSLLGLYLLFFNDFLVRRPVKSRSRWGAVWIFFVRLGNITTEDRFRLGVSQSKSIYTSPTETRLLFLRRERWIFNNRGVILTLIYPLVETSFF